MTPTSLHPCTGFHYTRDSLQECTRPDLQSKWTGRKSGSMRFCAAKRCPSADGPEPSPSRGCSAPDSIYQRMVKTSLGGWCLGRQPKDIGSVTRFPDTPDNLGDRMKCQSTDYILMASANPMKHWRIVPGAVAERVSKVLCHLRQLRSGFIPPPVICLFHRLRTLEAQA